MTLPNKPMLAVAAKDIATLRYPLLASPKLDGIRCLLHPDMGAVTRRFKPVPNLYTEAQLSKISALGLDGELVTFNDDGSTRTFNEIQGDVMRVAGEPNFKLLVFDCFTDTTFPFSKRLGIAQIRCGHHPEHLTYVQHTLIRDSDELARYEDAMVAAGFEGVMTRSPDGLYKSGRSTLRQEWLLKVKRFADAEGVVIGFEEEQQNTNEKTTNAVGHGERSTHKAGLVGKGTMGVLILETKEWGTVKVGSGFDAHQRQSLWNRREEVLGKSITFTYQPAGMKFKPRFPVFKGFRDWRDMS